MKSLTTRIVLSLLFAGAFQETLRIITNKESRSFFFLAAIGSFVLISVFASLRRTIKTQREVDNQLKQNDELIDDFK